MANHLLETLCGFFATHEGRIGSMDDHEVVCAHNRQQMVVYVIIPNLEFCKILYILYISSYKTLLIPNSTERLLNQTEKLLK